jgi:chromatin remodeling complex protein RSC6
MAKKKAAKKATTKKVAKKATKKAPAKKATAKKATKKAAPKKATKKVAAPKKAKATKKAAAPKATKKAVKAAKPKTKRKPNAAFMRPLTPSATLAAVIGSSPIPRTEAVKKLWQYIKSNKLQEKRDIHADDKLKVLFGKAKVTMFELAGILSKHLS